MIDFIGDIIIYLLLFVAFVIAAALALVFYPFYWVTIKLQHVLKKRHGVEDNGEA